MNALLLAIMVNDGDRMSQGDGRGASGAKALWE